MHALWRVLTVRIVSRGNLLVWVFYLQMHDKHLSWPVMSEELRWGVQMTKRAAVCFGRCASVCVCWDNGIIEVLGVTGALMPG